MFTAFVGDSVARRSIRKLREYLSQALPTLCIGKDPVGLSLAEDEVGVYSSGYSEGFLTSRSDVDESKQDGKHLIGDTSQPCLIGLESDASLDHIGEGRPALRQSH